MVRQIRKELTDKKHSQVATSLSFGLLTLATAALMPSAAQAVSFSFGDPAAIALFRGAGGLLGSTSGNSGPSGIDTLERRIDSAFADYSLNTQGAFLTIKKWAATGRRPSSKHSMRLLAKTQSG